MLINRGETTLTDYQSKLISIKCFPSVIISAVPYVCYSSGVASDCSLVSPTGLTYRNIQAPLDEITPVVSSSSSSSE